MKRKLFTILASVMLLALILASVMPAYADEPAPSRGNGKTTLNPGVYVIEMSDKPVVAYDGGVAGLKATKPQKGQKIDPLSSAVVAYVSYLDGRRRRRVCPMRMSSTKSCARRWTISGS